MDHVATLHPLASRALLFVVLLAGPLRAEVLPLGERLLLLSAGLALLLAWRARWAALLVALGVGHLAWTAQPAWFALLPWLLAHSGVAGVDALGLDRYRALGRGTLPRWNDALHRPLEPPPRAPGVLLALAAAMGPGGLLLLGIEPPRALLAGLLLLAPWDRIHRAGSERRELLVVYDDGCAFCARTLRWLRALDARGALRFLGPGEYEGPRPPVDFREALVVFEDERAHVGYHGVRRLLRAFAFLGPLVWVLGWPPVVEVGERAYAWVAENRGRWSSCTVEPDEERRG